MVRSVRAALVAVGLVLSVTFAILYNYKLTGSDAQICRNIRMGPTYARILGFDEEFTNYASKYSLYLYRERGKDTVPTEDNDFQLDGIPVLFIPGNAGSYRQVRSIASKASNLAQNKLDFFTADFNEDFTAFHGRTMLDQAEYLNEAIKFILRLYQNKYRSVMIVGHSMGGVVSRVMVTLPNYQPESINTIITLSAPHSRSALTFDRDIMKIYQAVNDFWYLGFHPDGSELSKVAHKTLEEVAIVSVAGGVLDSIVPADYTSLRSIVPSSNAISVFASGIQGVWTSIDHLAIVWCDQLRTVIAETLLLVAQLDDLEDRMKVFRKNFLTGFESEEIEPSEVVTMSFDSVEKQSKKIVKKADTTVFQNTGNATFQIFTEELSENGIFVCSEQSKEDLEEDLSLKCYDITSKLSMIPKSNGVKSIRDSTLGDRTTPYYGMVLLANVLQGFEHIAITNMDATVDYSPETIIEARVSKLLLTTITLEPALRTKVVLKDIRNSLDSFDMNIKNFDSLDFKPMIKQFISEEVKWHITNPINLNYHGNSPFFNDDDIDALELEIWNPEGKPLVLEFKYSLWMSMKVMIIRYRLTIVSYGLIFVLLGFVLQLLEYSKTSKFPSLNKQFDKLVTIRNLFSLTAINVIILVFNRFRIFQFLVARVFFEQDTGINSLGYRNSTPVFFIFVVLSIFLNLAIYLLIWGLRAALQGAVSGIDANNRVRTILVFLLMASVVIYLPYQVIYMVLTLVQAIKVLKTKNENEANFAITLLMMMLWVLPINVPIVIVLIHNLTINWKTSFTSHHNILSILPIAILVNYRKTIQFKYVHLLVWFIVYFAGYCFFYGSINTFWIHHLFNYLCIGLIVSEANL